MKKWKEKWAAVSRGKKLLVYTTVLLICVTVSYVAIGSPSFSPRMEFRRLEKAYMVGPSTILAEFELDIVWEKHVFIGETEDSYILHAISDDNFFFTNFYCYPKTNAPALFHIPGSSARVNLLGDSEPMMLILFDLEPRAVRAELEMDCPHPTKEGETVHISVESQRKYDKFFLFYFRGLAHDDTLEDIYADLAKTCREYGRYDQYVTVRLYDAQGQLLREETILAGPTLPEAP